MRSGRDLCSAAVRSSTFALGTAGALVDAWLFVGWQAAVSRECIRGLALTPSQQHLVAAASDGCLALLDLRRGGATSASALLSVPARCCLADEGLAAAGTAVGQVRQLPPPCRALELCSRTLADSVLPAQGLSRLHEHMHAGCCSVLAVFWPWKGWQAAWHLSPSAQQAQVSPLAVLASVTTYCQRDDTDLSRSGHACTQTVVGAPVCWF